ncbi:MAG TPA: STAS domain-containing protein [Acidimicrobiales bacterium]|nr:STAS domain-containing protein [Acidimicrobiales bacterium]
MLKGGTDEGGTVADDAGTNERLGAMLRTHRDVVLGRWIELVSSAMGPHSTTQEVEAELGTLYGAIADSLASGARPREQGFGEVRAMLSELSHDRARLGFSPTETAATVLNLKVAALSAVGDSLSDYVALSDVVDDLAAFTFEAYVAARETVITELAEQLLELSTPVVKLWEGVVAVPLVGTLDSARTQVVMEKLLQVLVDTGSDHAIIDITGVPAVDTQVAQHLLKTVVAARLMGAECVISGIRPQIAQTIVALGIEFGDIVTKASLADALQIAISAGKDG